MVRARELLKRYPDDLQTSVQPARRPWRRRRRSACSIRSPGPICVELGEELRRACWRKIRALPDAVDADTSLVIGKPELRVEIDRQRAADLGVRVQDIAQALNVLIGGDNVTTFNVGNNQYDVTLRAAEQFRSSLEGLAAHHRRLVQARGRAARRRGSHRARHRTLGGRAAEPPASGHALRANRARREPGVAHVADRRRRRRASTCRLATRRRRPASRSSSRARPPTSSSPSRCPSSSCTSCSRRSSSRSSIRSRSC